MGQTIGRAPLPVGCKRFVNLPKSCIYELWDAFNDIAEGFGLTIEEFHDIVKSALLEHLDITEKILINDMDVVFRLFDDDENSLVDSLEFLSSFALLSGMTPEEKIRFIFAMYDFEETSLLTLDEMVLAVRSTLSGLSKLSKIDPPTEAEIENIVIQAFQTKTVNDVVASDNKTGTFDNEHPGIEKEEFVSFCMNTPEITSWIEYFDDLEENDIDDSYNEVKPKNLPEYLQRNIHDNNNQINKFDNKDPLWKNILPLLNAARISDKPPESVNHNFNIDWIYGFNCHSTRQSIYYTAKGEIIYPAGSICVIEKIDSASQTSTQRYYKCHQDLITCLKVYKREDGNTIVGTGECGLHPIVNIWDTQTLTTLASIKGYHRQGIIQLDFSFDGTKIIILGIDLYHCISVYEWKTQQRLFSARTTADEVCDIRFISSDMFATCGHNHIYFWKETNLKRYKRYRGLFGPSVKPEMLLCVTALDNYVLTAAYSGTIYVWEGRNLISSVKGHTAPILSCHTIKQTSDATIATALVTACSLGKIQIWNSKLEITASFNGSAVGSIDTAIVGICWDMISSKILLGFKSGEIIELDAIDGRNLNNKSVVAGHSSPSISGIAVHPFIPKIFCTVGDDKTIRIFDSEQKKELKASNLGSKGHCCSFSNDGQLILIGLGYGKRGFEERKEGGFLILNEEDLTIVYEGRDSKDMITNCKFASNGEYFALSSLDALSNSNNLGSLYLYHSKDFSIKAKCSGHNSGISHFDISIDSTSIMSNGLNGELLFWDTVKGDMITPKAAREIQWDTNTCIYSYITQGIFQSVDNNVNFNIIAKSNSKDLLVVACNDGIMRVFASPCLKEDSPYISLYGHSANVQNCIFSCDDKYLYSTGGTDGCIIQWLVTLPETQSYVDMKHDDTIQTLLTNELLFEGKSLDKSENFYNVINNIPKAKCELEEGLVGEIQMLPWQRTIVAPSRLPIEDNSEPSDNLQLEFINGIAVDRSRECLMYYSTGEIVFFVGSIVVLMNQKKRTQRFYNEHTSTVTALASHPTLPVIASGDLNNTPSIRIWDPLSLNTLCILKGFHKRAICHIKFSPDGNYIITVGHDKFHSVAIYDWRIGALLSTSQSFTNKSLCISYSPSGNSFIHCGNEIIKFSDIINNNVISKIALFGKRVKLQGFLSIGWIGNNAVIGTADGNLYRFIGRQLDGVVLAHSSCINSISSSSEGICTASSDGYIKVWSRILECRLVVDSRNFHCITPDIRIISWDFNLNKLLFSTISSEIYEITSTEGENIHIGPLIQGHSGDDLWGLAINPTKDQFCTVGDDAILRYWDTITHLVTETVTLEMPSRCCAFSPDGRHLAIGFGCPKKVKARQYDGKWTILDTSDNLVTHEARDSSKWITDIKYSPNGEFIAMGSYDNKIYVYNISSGYALSAVITHHHAYITSIDFSEDSCWIQSNCAGFELAYFEADTGLFIPAASRLRDTTWATQNCSLGWSVQGIWPPQREGTEITSCECNLFRGNDGPVAVSGDNYGRIQVYRYPCISYMAISKKYQVSSNPITRVRFASGDSHLVALSGLDKAIVQFSHKRDRDESVAWNVVERIGAVEEEEDDIVKFFGFDISDYEIKQSGTLSLSRPWISTMVAPTITKPLVLDPPNYKLKMNHIFGVQTERTRFSIYYTNEGDIIYPTSRYVCLYNRKSNKQQFYSHHKNELSCVSLSNDRAIIASAERTKRPLIHIWDSISCELLVVLSLIHRLGVVSMKFSIDRKYLVSIGIDQDHSIAVWFSASGEWTDGTLLASSKGDVNPVLFCNFLNHSNKRYDIVSGGRFHIKFWNIHGTSLNSSYPEYDPKYKIGTLLCGCSSLDFFVSGSTSGHFYIWRDRKLDRMVRAHELAVTCLTAIKGYILSASKDGFIKLWSSNLEYIKTFNLKDADVPPMTLSIRSLDALLSTDTTAITRILSVTTGGEVFEIAAISGSISLINESHYSGQLWGLSTHPTDPDIFATCGDDRTIRVWSINHRRIIRKAIIDCTARCLSWSSDGKLLIVGLGGSSDGKRQRKDGAFLLMDAVTLRPVFEGRDSRHWLQDVKISPDGKLFAVASMDHKIYIYNRENFRLRGTCDRNNSYVRTIDFSIDSAYLQSDSGDYEHLYFESEDGQHISTSSQLRDIIWSDWTCIYGWPVQGIWPSYENIEKGLGSDPTTVHRSYDNNLLAAGYSKGSIKVYKYPCTTKDAQAIQLDNAHISEVSKIKFTCNNSHIISIGKIDRSIIIWKLIEVKEQSNSMIQLFLDSSES